MNEEPKVYQWGLPAALGLFIMVIGGIAITVPLLATFEISWFMGALFILSGIAQLIHTFQFDPTRSRAGRFMLAALSVVAGFLVLKNPMTGAFAITLVMALYFLAVSMGRTALIFELKYRTGKGWLAFSAIISFILGIYLLSTLSTSSLIIPGLFLGVDLVFYGVTLIALGAELKKYGTIAESDWPRKAA